MKNNKVGVIIGRFQIDDLHKAHKLLIDKVLEKSSRVIIFIGTSVVLDSKRNPLDFRTREMMVRAHLEHLGEQDRVAIMPLPDQHTDELWSSELDRRIREIDPMGKATLYGARDSFIGHYKGRNAVETLNLEKEVSATLSASAIREKIASEPLNSRDFRAGIIHAKYNQWPKVHPTVDVIITRTLSRGLEVLLGQKLNESTWRLIGGFTDPTDDGYEAASTREGIEETKLNIGNLKYVCSKRVDDWRYRAEENKIITTFFEADYISGVAEAHDDIKNVNWFTIEELTHMLEQINLGHIPLVDAFLKKHNLQWQQ